MCKSLKFDDMTETQRASWLRWANSHDWASDHKPRFVSRLGHIEMEVGCLETDGCGDDATVIEYCRTPRELRDWAGY